MSKLIKPWDGSRPVVARHSTDLRRGVVPQVPNQRCLRRSTGAPLYPTCYWVKVGRRRDCGPPGWAGASPGSGRLWQPRPTLSWPTSSRDTIGRVERSNGASRPDTAVRRGVAESERDAAYRSGDTASAALPTMPGTLRLIDTVRGDIWWCLFA